VRYHDKPHNTMPNDTIPDGKPKGLTEKDVRDAVEEYRSMRGAARALEVSRKAIRDWCWR